MTRNEVIILARKLHALATQGVDGERENAKMKLQMVIDKWRLRPEEIEKEPTKWYRQKLKADQMKFFRQILYSVQGEDWNTLQERSCAIRYEATYKDMIEITDRFKHYWPIYEKEMKIFYQAFVQKNKLFGNPDRVKKQKLDRDLTPEELEELRRLFQMMEGISESPLNRKKLNQ